MDKNTASFIVDGIIADLKDRGGLGDEWDQIDEDTQQEIRETWIEIAEKA
jgi:hypothetical protein